MRPVEKGQHPITPVHKKKMVLNDYTKAIPILKKRTGLYCHLCEMRFPTLAIEHIKPQEHFPRLSSHWDNFLLICTYCNSRKNDTIPYSPYRKHYVWPHLNNTLLVFKPNKMAIIETRTNELTDEQTERGNNLIDLYKLAETHTAGGDTDTRWLERAQTFIKAINTLKEYNENKVTIPTIVSLATSTGFFSLWFKIFQDVFDVKKHL